MKCEKMLKTKLPKRTTREIISLRNTDIVRINNEYYGKEDFYNIEWIDGYTLLKELCDYRDCPEQAFPIRQQDIDELQSDLSCYNFHRDVLIYILTIIRKYELAERKRVKHEIVGNFFNINNI